MKSLRVPCTVLTGLFVAIVVASAAAALSDLSLIRYLDGILAGEPADSVRAERIDNLQGAIAIVEVSLMLACAVAFCVWFYRAHKNLRVGGLGGFRHASGWAAGGFFVPGINVVRPCRMMTEVWKGSALLSGDAEARSWQAVPLSHLVGWWWGGFILTSVLGNVAGRLLLRANEVEELLTAAWVSVAADVANIPAALLALLLVRRVTDLQQRGRALPSSEVSTSSVPF